MLPPHARQNGEMASRPPASSHPDTFGARADLTVGDRTYEIFNIKAPALARALRRGRLPYSDQGHPGEPPAPRGRPHVSADDIVAVAALGRQPRGATARGPATPPTRSPSPPSGCSCRTSPACPAWSTWPPCATPWPRLGRQRRRRSTRWSRSSSSSTTRSSPRRSGDAVGLRRATSPLSTSATSSATSCCAGPRAPSTASGRCPPGMGICHQVNLEYLSRLVFATDGRPGLLRHPGRHRLAHDHGQRAGRPRLGRRRHRGRGGHARPTALHAAAPGGGPPDLRRARPGHHGDRRRADRHRAAARPRRGRARSSSATAPAWPPSRSRRGPPSAT